MIRQVPFVIPVMVCAMLAPSVSGWVHAGSVEVVISKEADELEQFAAEELQRYLRRPSPGRRAVSVLE